MHNQIDLVFQVYVGLRTHIAYDRFDWLPKDLQNSEGSWLLLCLGMAYNDLQTI